MPKYIVAYERRYPKIKKNKCLVLIGKTKNTSQEIVKWGHLSCSPRSTILVLHSIQVSYWYDVHMPNNQPPIQSSSQKNNLVSVRYGPRQSRVGKDHHSIPPPPTKWKRKKFKMSMPQENVLKCIIFQKNKKLNG